jgi:nucleoside-diphosphate-sugar epimerase
MRILLTDPDSPLGMALVRALSPRHEVRTLDGDPRDRDTAAEATRDVDAVIHAVRPVDAFPSPLDALDAATRGTYNLISTAEAASRFVLLSSLRPFERYPVDDLVNENWAPRPTTAVDDLVPYLAELTAREVARVRPIKAIGLRMGEVVTDDDPRGGTDPRWLHVDDAIQAVERALDFEPPAAHPRHGWWEYHIVGAGRTRFPLGAAQSELGYAPRHDLAGAGAVGEEARRPTPSRLSGRPGGGARTVVVYGAGGPLAAITTEALVRDHVLRLTDVQPIAEIAARNQPQSPGSPLPRPLGPPHEMRVVDVTDPEAVSEAARGMDAIVNCTVVRPHPVEAFRVNVLGAYNVMQAAVANGIRRVVHTGPQQVTLRAPAGYWGNLDLSPDVPSRPGDNLYILTKYLGQEICRIFAEEHDLEVPALLFSSFVNPATPPPQPLGAYPFSVSWEDAAEAMRGALRAPDFPHPFEPFFILGDLPHGRYSNEKAKRLLHWQPRDSLAGHWRRGE